MALHFSCGVIHYLLDSTFWVIWAFSRKFSQKSVLLYPWFLAFLSVLCFFAPLCRSGMLCWSGFYLVFPKRAIFSHYGKWESPKKYRFFDETKKHLINKVCVNVTQAWKIGKCSNKRKIEGSTEHFFGKLFAKMLIWQSFFLVYWGRAWKRSTMWYPKKGFHTANFYRAVRNSVNFSLVTKLTKHVSKVRETVRKCE